MSMLDPGFREDDPPGAARAAEPESVTRSSAGLSGAQLLEDVGDVGGHRGFLDVVRVRDLLAGVAQLSGGGLGVGFPVDEGRHGLAERVGNYPGQVGVPAGLTPLTA